MTLCHYAECCCAECHDLFIVMLNVIRPSVVILSVVAPRSEPNEWKWSQKNSSSKHSSLFRRDTSDEDKKGFAALNPKLKDTQSILFSRLAIKLDQQSLLDTFDQDFYPPIANWSSCSINLCKHVNKWKKPLRPLRYCCCCCWLKIDHVSLIKVCFGFTSFIHNSIYSKL